MLQSERMEIGGFELKDGAYVFGFPHEWSAFQKRHAKFLEAFDPLADTNNRVKVRTFDSKCPADDTVFFLGSLVSEDFTEVWLLAGNGMGRRVGSSTIQFKRHSQHSRSWLGTL